MWWILSIIVIGYIIYLISKDYKGEVRTNVTNKGGIQQKYKIVIDYFVNNLPAKITKLTNDSVVISASATTVYLDYVGGSLEVELKGIAPIIGNYSKKWKYPNGYPQEKMITEIQNYSEWQAKRVIRSLSLSDNKKDDEAIFRRIVKEEFDSTFNEFQDAIGDSLRMALLIKNTVDSIELKTHLTGINISSDKAQMIIDEVVNELDNYFEIITLQEFLDRKGLAKEELGIAKTTKGVIVMTAYRKPIANIEKELQGIDATETANNLAAINIALKIYSDKTKLPCVIRSNSQWEEVALF